MRLDVKGNLNIAKDDSNIWQKVGICGLASLFMLPAPILLGYQMDIIRSTADGYDDGLPSLRDYGRLWISGAIAMVVMLALIMVPAGILTSGIVFGAVALGFAEGGGLFAGLGLAAGFFLLFGIMLLFSVVCPALLLRYTMTGEIWSLVNIRQAVSDVFVAPLDYCVLLLVPLVGAALAGVVGSFTFGLGSVFVTAFAAFVQARLMGEYFRLYLQ